MHKRAGQFATEVSYGVATNVTFANGKKKEKSKRIARLGAEYFFLRFVRVCVRVRACMRMCTGGLYLLSTP